MQQMYSCPNCQAPVAYGQPSCSSCNMVFNWPSAPADTGSPHHDQPQNSDDGPGLLQWINDNRAIIVKISVSLVIVAVLIGAGIALQGVVSKWFAVPVVASFDAGPSTIMSGQEVTLQWAVTGASSVSISPDIGTVFSNGTRIVSPEKTTAYTLVASNMSGSVRKSITITVTAALPSINSFSSNADSIFAGQSATLSWSVAGATSVSINPDVGPVSLNGTKNVSPGSTTKYLLTASNDAGNSTASALLTVTPSKIPIITTFSAGPASINAGEPSTLTWDVIGAKSINISQGIGGVAAKGSTQVTPAATATYTLTADSDYGSATRPVTVTVDTTNATGRPGTAITKNPPAITTFSVSQNSIMLGDNIKLTWDVSGARTVSISPDVGTVPSSGWAMVIPTAATTTYKLSAVNTFGTETAETSVTVNTSADGTAPVIKSFIAAPTSISAGGTSTLTWAIKGATLYTIDQGIGIPASKFSQTVSPSENTTYTLTAINSSGTDRAIAVVIVVP